MAVDVAVIGLACRFAQAPDADAYWDNVLAARECFSEIPEARWHNAAFHSERRREHDKSYVTRGGFIEDVASFGAMHFGVAPRRVQHMDPQHRLTLECVRNAFQDAGLERELHAWIEGEYEPAPRPTIGDVGADGISPPHRFEPTRTGTFLGLSSSEYRDIIGARAMAVEMAAGGYGVRPSDADARALLDSVSHIAPISSFSMSGTLLNMSAANVAHHWGLRGPAYTIDAACASALVAVADAVLMLRAGLCDAAIAGGAYFNFTPVNLISFSRIGAISRQGRCRPFDANADGFLQGDGVGVVVLKRLDDALRDGDRIRAVIRGVGVNNDGSQSSGPMAPSLDGQVEAIELAQRDAQIEPASIDFIECHGTATPVGDPVEVGALRTAFEPALANGHELFLSSAKANVGHTMSAAGIAGLIRAILALETATIPPQAAFESPNPRLDLSGIRIPTAPTPWQRDDTPRRAGVSSFGFGGTNCHVVVEEAPSPTAVTTRQDATPAAIPPQQRSRPVSAARVLPGLQPPTSTRRSSS